MAEEAERGRAAAKGVREAAEGWEKALREALS